jgi:hypothetical protein
VLLRLARWLDAYGPQLTVALGAIAFAFISLIPRVRDEGWLWLVSSTTGIVFLGAAVLTLLGTIISGRRTRNARSLSERVEELEGILERVRVDYYDQFSIELSNFLRGTLGYGDTERVSVYRHRGRGAFQMIGRYSENPVYAEPGRTIYPDDQGVIGAAWRHATASVDLPNPQEEPERYYQSLERDWNISRETAESFAMKSRSLVARALYEPRGHVRVAVVVVESTGVGILDEEKVMQAIDGTEGERIYEFLERMRSLEPDIEYAREEGFG